MSSTGQTAVGRPQEEIISKRAAPISTCLPHGTAKEPGGDIARVEALIRDIDILAASRWTHGRTR